jgi:hypothetical protein
LRAHEENSISQGHWVSSIGLWAKEGAEKVANSLISRQAPGLNRLRKNSLLGKKSVPQGLNRLRKKSKMGENAYKWEDRKPSPDL